MHALSVGVFFLVASRLLRVAFDDLALGPVINRTVLYVLAGFLYLTAVRSLLDTALRPFVLGLLGYWLICAALIAGRRKSRVLKLTIICSRPSTINGYA